MDKFVFWHRTNDDLALAEKLGAPPHCESISIEAQFGQVPKITFVCFTTPDQWALLAEHFKQMGKR